MHDKPRVLAGNMSETETYIILKEQGPELDVLN